MAGTRSHTRLQLQEELQKLNAQINADGGGRGGGMSSATATITAPADNFLAAVRLAVEILKEPAYPPDEFERVKTQRIKALEIAPTEPALLATERLNRHLSPFDKRDAPYAPTREEQLSEIKNVKLEDARKFHDQFYGANYGVFALVGPVALADVKKAAMDLLGAWNTGRAYKPLLTPFRKVAPINETIETPDNANAQFVVGERFQLSQSDPAYPAILLASSLFGEPITSRISNRIRNREGLSYGANARVTVPAEGDSATLAATVSLNPGVGPKVEASFVDELKNVYEGGFTARKWTRPRRPTWSSHGRTVDRRRAAQLIAPHEQLDRPWAWDATWNEGFRRSQSIKSTPRSVSISIRRRVHREGWRFQAAGCSVGPRAGNRRPRQCRAAKSAKCSSADS